jgi:hypothetical protein
MYYLSNCYPGTANLLVWYKANRGDLKNGECSKKRAMIVALFFMFIFGLEGWENCNFVTI